MLAIDFTLLVAALSPALPVYIAADNDDGMHRMPIVRVGRHRPPGKLHPEVPVELFTDRWGAAAGKPMTLKEILADLKPMTSKPTMVRIGVPTDEGHHRILDILKVGVDSVDGKMVAMVDVEPWNSGYKVVRLDEE